MPHLISGRAQLSAELGITSTHPLGTELLPPHTSHAEYDSTVEQFQTALQHFAQHPDPDVQRVRELMDNRFRQDTRDAPSDFAFSMAPGESITARLAQANIVELTQFSSWNTERTAALRGAIGEHMPALRKVVESRASRLVSMGLITARTQVMFSDVAGQICNAQAYKGLDSFEGGWVHGLSGASGIALARHFEGGYHFDQPTEKFWETGFHEIEHQVFARKDPFRKLKLLEELLIVHHTTVSSPDNTAAAHSIYETAAPEQGSYGRKLFGLLFEHGPKPIALEQAGKVLEPGDFSMGALELVRSLAANFTAAFPEHGENAMQLFFEEYKQSTFPFDQMRCAQRWFSAAFRQIYGTQANPAA